MPKNRPWLILLIRDPNRAALTRIARPVERVRAALKMAKTPTSNELIQKMLADAGCVPEWQLKPAKPRPLTVSAYVAETVDAPPPLEVKTLAAAYTSVAETYQRYNCSKAMHWPRAVRAARKKIRERELAAEHRPLD